MILGEALISPVSPDCSSVLQSLPSPNLAVVDKMAALMRVFLFKSECKCCTLPVAGPSCQALCVDAVTSGETDSGDRVGLLHFTPLCSIPVRQPDLHSVFSKHHVQQHTWRHQLHDLKHRNLFLRGASSKSGPRNIFSLVSWPLQQTSSWGSWL